jgi:hypothetical protein
MNMGGAQTYVVKHRSHAAPELFNREKLHKSIVAASLSAGAPAGHAETIAKKVTEHVIGWLKDRPEVTSNDLRRTAAQHLKTHHPDASYLYEHHQSTL